MTKRPPQNGDSARTSVTHESSRTVTAPWHTPKCSVCHRPIDDPSGALALWFNDSEHRSHSPMLVHVGDCWKRVTYSARANNEHDLSLHVDALRRSPMEAIIVAMRRRANSEAERLVWHSWISVVLGLPFGDESTLLPRGDVADVVHDHVITIDEARSITGEQKSDDKGAS
jgi:hypothetical protein